MKQNNKFSSIHANYEQNLAIAQGVHISNVDYAHDYVHDYVKTSHNPLVTSICGTSGSSCPHALVSSFAFSSGSSLFLSGYSPHSSAYIPISSAGFYYQFASACRGKGGKYLAASLMAASLLQGIMAPYALAVTYDVNDGDVRNNFTLNSRDIQNVNSGGIANSTTINQDGNQYVSNGGIANSTTINNVGYQHVSSGGLASGTTVNSGGIQHVSSGGLASGNTVNSGGKQYVSNGGIASGTIVFYYGEQNIDSGGIASGTTINSGGYQHVRNSGIASGTIVFSGGVQVIYSGGIASGTTVNSGRQHVLSVGLASGTTVNSGGWQDVYSGGIASGTTINSGGRQTIDGGASAHGTIVNFGGVQIFAGATATSNVTNNSLNSGASQVFQSGAVASAGGMGGTVGDGITQILGDGGSAVNVTVNNVGFQHVSSGGVASGTTVNSGGSQNVFDGGVANSTTIDGGEQAIYSGGIANSTTITNGAQHLISNGIATFTTISGGTQIIFASGLASGTIVSSGGSQLLFNYGSAGSVTVNNGGVQVFYGARATNNVTNNTLNSGASQVFQNGAVASSGGMGGTVSAGITQIIEDGGSAVGVTVNNGGVQNVSNGGVASGTNINGGRQNVSNAGTASGTTINNGTQHISNGGVASGTTINNGTQHISNGGVASGTTISGGTQIVSGGGTANITTVLNGGLQSVETGGSAISSIISSGGSLNIAAGAIVTSTLLQGGTIAGNATYVAGQILRGEGGNITGDVTFNGGTFIPVLDINDTDANKVVVANNVRDTDTGTIAPVWQNGVAIAQGQSATFDVLESTGGTIDGTFGTTTELVSATYTQQLNAANNLLQLVVTRRAAGFSAQYANYLTPNGQRLAVILDTLDANGQLPTLMTALGNLPASGEAVAAAIRQLVPESFSTANGFNQNIIRAFMAQRPSIAKGTFIQIADNSSESSGMPAGSPITSEFNQNTWQFFGSPFGFTASQQSNDDYSGYDMTAAGVNLGLVRSFDNYWLGASLGYSNQYLKMKDIEAKIDSDQFMLSVFGGVRYNDFFAEAALGYAHTWNNSSRNVSIGAGLTAYNDELTANYGQDSFLASLTLGYIFEFDNDFRIIPSVGVDYVHTHSHGFEESGGNAALGTEASSFNSLQIPVSITLEKSFTVDEAILTPSLTASWKPELGDTYSTTNSNFVNAPSAGGFETKSIESDRHTFAFGAGLDMQFSENFGMAVNYELNTRSMYTDHSIDLEFKWEF